MILDILYKGFVIGICISAPVGPIGVLCIQRTLHKGPKHGLITGLGATTSDLVYALMAIFGVGYVIDFIQHNELAIQIIGSVVIFLFGIYIFNCNPVKQQLSKDDDKKGSYLQDFFTSFGVTITNPLIIFILIALFARFQFVPPKLTLDYVTICVASILLGAFAWWLILTSIVNLFRTKFGERGFWLINKITGTSIMGIALFGLGYSVFFGGRVM